MALSCVSTVQNMVIAFQIGAIINLQRFQLGEASHGFLSGQMQQAIAIHNIQLLKRGKIAQPLWQNDHLIKSLYPQNFKGNVVLNLVQEQEGVG